MSTSSTNGPLALDLDGTLLDARPRQVAALLDLLGSEPGLPAVGGERLWELKREGLTTGAALERLGLAPEPAARLAQGWVKTVEERRWLALDRLLPGVAAALEGRAAGGPRPLVLTARQHPGRVREQVEALGLLRWCAEVRVVDPHAAAEQKAAELGRRGCRGLIGDTESDARAAELAALPFAAVSTGQRSAAFLRGRGLAVHDSLAAALGTLGDC